MTLCYLGIGSNQQQPIQQIKNAVAAIKQLSNADNVTISSLYSSQPMGPQDQPDYVNAVIKLNWQANEINLLDALQKIEQEQGRVRKSERWGPRTLDLDILLFGSLIMDTPRLTIPHYGMKIREFVLYPLAELAPNLTLPCGTLLTNLLNTVPLNGLTKLTTIV